MAHAVYDPLDPSFLADPYPAFAWLRENDPVHHHPRDGRSPGFWALSRFEDIWEAVRRPDLYSSAQGLTFFSDEIGQLGIPPTMVMLDPPVQTQLRSLIGRGFTPKRVTVLEDRIRTFVRSQIQRMEQRWDDGETVDLHQHFASTIPTYVLAELFGLPVSDHPRFAPWVHALTQLQNDGFSLDAAGDAGSAALSAMAEMMEYFSSAIAARRHDPSDDLLGAREGRALQDLADRGRRLAAVHAVDRRVEPVEEPPRHLVAEPVIQGDTMVQIPMTGATQLIPYVRP